MDWDDVDQKLKTPEQIAREAAAAVEAQSAETRSQIAAFAATMVPELETLQRKLAVKQHLQASLEFGGRAVRVHTTKGLFGVETSQDGLSIDVQEDEYRETVVFARNLEHWELASDSRHNPIDPVQYFERRLSAFVDRVLKS